MRNNKGLLMILVVALVLAGLYFRNNQPPTTETTMTDEAMMEEGEAMMEEDKMVGDEVVITYTDDGFEPQTVTVQVGTTVTFVNESTTDMWVASALHPTHQELPGFDQLEGSGSGARYSYTFKEVGTWRFHDHLNPTVFGSVVVE